MREPQMIGESDTVPDTGIPPRPPREHITISLSLRTISIIFGILLAVWIVRELSSTLLIFAGAILLATAIDKPVAHMQDRGVPRGIGILIIFGIITGLLVAVVAVLIPLVTTEASLFVDQIGDYETRFEDLLRRFGISTSIHSGVSLNQIGQNISGHVNTIATGLTSFALGVGHAAVVIFAMLVIAFMLAMDPTAGTRFARRFLTGDAHDRLTRITSDVDSRIGGWVRGQLLVAATFGIVFGCGLWLIGLPFAASLGLTAGVLEVIPYLGGALTVVIATAVALTIGLPQTLLVIVLYAMLINLESHILAPRFIGNAVGLPSVVVLMALFIGLESKGIVGVMLAVPASLVLTAILDELWPAPEQPGKDDKDDKDDKEQSLFVRMQQFLLRFRHADIR